ncbi:MAG: DUF3078 domain-containing protein [Bacteroidales bacterium]|nr:DUF3078 domain-containing protein [Bacteroidales bacterium]
MKKLTFFVISVLLSSGLLAQEVQDSTNWKISRQASINFSQLSFSNWIAGGKNSVSGVGLLDLNANYKKDKIHWDNSLKAGYGLMKEGDNELIKNEDKLDLNTKLGVEMKNEHLLFSTFMNFLTQFADGYKYPNTADKISGLFAPAYLTIASGLDYQSSEMFSLFFTPVSGKFTFVLDDQLSDIGAFGVDPGKKTRAEMGAAIKSEFKTPVAKNVNLSTSLMLFSNYFHQPQNIDVNWDVAINMKINEYLSANLLTNLIYDHDILIPLDNEGNVGRRVQFKQLFGVGLNIKF